jgi:hypothetical protein
MRHRNDPDRLNRLLQFVGEHPEPAWRAESPPPLPTDFPYRVENDFRGYDLFVYQNQWFAQPVGVPFDASQAEILWAPDEESIHMQVEARTPNHSGQLPPGRVERFVRNLLAEPIHCLPRRAWRTGGRVLKKLKKKVQT